MTEVAIIKSGGANYESIRAALLRLGVNSFVTDEPNKIMSASHVILPGVGSTSYAMNLLRDRNLAAVIKGLRQPLLGICLGQQLLCASSEEGNTECLGIIPLNVKKLINTKIIPHMGWDNMDEIIDESTFFDGTSIKDDFYYVHSYATEINTQYTLASCHYGSMFSAAINRDNFYGVQFHPEKSGEPGLQILRNFLRLS